MKGYGWTPTTDGRRALSAEQLAAFKRSQTQKQQRGALKANYIEVGQTKGNKNPHGAAKKPLQRHRQRSETPEDIARSIRGRGIEREE